MRKLLALLFLVACVLSPPISAKKPAPKVVVTRFDTEQVAELQKAVPGVRLVHAEGAEGAMRHISDADALIGVLNEDLVRAGKRLRWIQVLSAGVDRYRYPELVDSDIVLTNAKIIQGANVGDHAMALLLTLSRGVHHAIRKKDWDRGHYYGQKRGPIELEGKTALVVGLGGIGTAIARRCHGFGMKVVGVDPNQDKGGRDFVESIHPPDALHQVLAKADVVVLAVPLTKQTEGMLGAEELAVMKEDALLVNIARGKVIDTAALLATLEKGKLLGVGLDVTDPEPLPPEHPLWSFDNVVITPHIGGASDRLWERRMQLVEENLRRFVAGEPLRNVVDKQKGY
jgi:phosphoglycerate dehydrogenase-like enzyme